MPLDQWLAFTAASALFLLLPGPTVLMVVSHALAHGRRAAAATVAGVVLGDFVAMTASLAGAGALLAVSSWLFTALRWAGVVYLVVLGIRLWRAPAASPSAAEPAPARARGLMLHAFAITALNPKSLVFFLAFVPQFLDRSSGLWPQLALCEATFVTLAAANAGFYALTATAARRVIRQPRVQKTVNRAGGVLLIGAGVLASGLR